MLSSVSFLDVAGKEYNIKLLHSGDGKDEEVAAKTMNFPFWRISAHSDLIAFYNALDMGFM